MDTQTGFWGQTTGDRKHRYIGKHTYGIKIRDLVRKTAFGINFSVIGIENQSNIDYTFPVRAMSYDVGEYERQLKCIRRRLRRKGKDGQHLTAAEYLWISKRYTSLSGCDICAILWKRRMGCSYRFAWNVGFYPLF